MQYLINLHITLILASKNSCLHRPPNLISTLPINSETYPVAVIRFIRTGVTWSLLSAGIDSKIPYLKIEKQAQESTSVGTGNELTFNKTKHPFSLSPDTFEIIVLGLNTDVKR